MKHVPKEFRYFPITKKPKIMNLKFSIASLFMAIALLVSAGCTTEIGGVMNHPM